MSFSVVWTERAIRSLQQIPWREASAVDAAVIRLAATGEGDLRLIETSDGREWRLHAGRYFVRLTRDLASREIHVWSVHRGRQRK